MCRFWTLYSVNYHWSRLKTPRAGFPESAQFTPCTLVRESAHVYWRMWQNKWDADFPLKEAECKQKAYPLHWCGYAEKENTQGRRNILWLIAIHPPKKGWMRPNSLTVHTLNGSISMICQGSLYLRYGWLFPPHPSAVIASLLRVDFSVPALFKSLCRQKGRCSVMKHCLCLPVKANGSKHWFCFSTPVFEWQAHLCINKLHAAGQRHLYHSL